MTETIGRLQLPEHYLAERPQLFPGRVNYDWFVRKNRAELIREGALTKPTGRWLVQPEAFDKVVLAIGARRAQAS